MQTPDPIEAALARLMPTAMSVSGQRSIEEMLDGLAAELPASPVRRARGPLIGLAAAAVIAGLVAVPVLFNPASAPVTGRPALATTRGADGIQLVEESDRVESMSDEGWVANPDGSAMQAVRVRVVGENTLKDRETGYTVRVSEPREETILMPVSSF
ncbi:hypothetical protein [Luteolibacter sp. LG18]|uniref:hypothetical protein n=1 Tax=Luteolibacter sp. LG18 TaxID=2819286 RepID=UPI002B2F0A71|nr:hypothetical protein llg_41770 [Luteolibacter sp. LG18]